MRTGIVIATLAILLPAAGATGQEIATPWQEGYNSRVRLIAGNHGQPAAPRLVAGVEIRLGEGWKTYWRNPGESGGIPPRFDWSASKNLAAARVLYPAPERLKDALGDAIGYKRSVVFPIEITPRDAASPVELDLAVEYGICREICVPADVKLNARLSPELPIGSPAELSSALARVPRGPAARRPADPVLEHASANLGGSSPALAFVVAAPGNAPAIDLFVEAPQGIFLPLPKRMAGPFDGGARFQVDLRQETDRQQLKGKTLVLTMVTPAGASETTWIVD